MAATMATAAAVASVPSSAFSPAPFSLSARPASRPAQLAPLRSSCFPAGLRPAKAERLSAVKFVGAVASANDAEGDLIDGLQEYMSTVWERRRKIPPVPTKKDPLQSLFDEFDENGDGSISAKELTTALQNQGVKITEAQATKFITKADGDGNKTIERSEFEQLLKALSAQDLKTRQALRSKGK
eukprot:jgi/Chlat1/2693/Chrsp180S02871